MKINKYLAYFCEVRGRRGVGEEGRKPFDVLTTYQFLTIILDIRYIKIYII